MTVVSTSDAQQGFVVFGRDLCSRRELRLKRRKVGGKQSRNKWLYHDIESQPLGGDHRGRRRHGWGIGQEPLDDRGISHNRCVRLLLQ